MKCFLLIIVCIASLAVGMAQGQSEVLSYETYDLFKYYPADNKGNEPVYLGASPMNEATVQVFPDGVIKIYHAPGRYSDSVMSMESQDGGFTWSDPELIFKDSIIWQYPRRTLIDQKGNIHLLVFREPDLAVFHTLTSVKGKKWEPLQKIAEGRIGAIRGFIQTKSGRLIFAFHRRAWERKPPFGSSYTSSVWSDDTGKTWNQSTSRVVAPVFENYNGNNYGAVEPNLVQLSDGRILMLCRTQTGWLYQSFSDDEGETWSDGKPSIFHSSNSPADLLKLADGRIVITWCNTAVTELKTFGRIYTHRDVLHMAISDDDGQSWTGFREIFRIPTRNDQNDLPGGDSGVSYPNTAFTTEKKIILVTGQGEHGGGRAMFLVSTEWLYETSLEDDFSNGLEKWSCYTFSKLSKKPGRNLGPELLDDASAKGGKILHVRKLYPGIFGDGAVLNFPKGRKGELNIRLKVLPGSKGTSVSLTDHHRHPNDPDGERTAMFICDSKSFPENRWQLVTLKWDLENKNCEIFLDHIFHEGLELQNETGSGISYVRFRSLAPEGSEDPHGLLVDWVNVKINN